MRKKLLYAAAFLFFFALTFYGAREASAIPAFARQTGFACTTCHYQHFPELNEFGRSFKAGGFTMVGGQSLIEGEALSLPSVLNATVMGKVAYNNTYGHNGEQGTSGANVVGKPTEFDHGTWDFPQDMSLFLAGRAGEHVGFLTEINLLGNSVSGGTADPRAVSLKVPFVLSAMDTQFLIEPYTTDGAGPSWSFEVLNTGITETHTPLLHKSETSAPQYVGVGTSATGVAFVAYQPLGYINYSLWANDHAGFSGDHQRIASPLHYIRLAVTPKAAGWDLGFGGAAWLGRETRGPMDLASGLTRDRARAWALDAQAMGNVMDYPVGVYLAYANAGKTNDSDFANNLNNIFNAGAKDKTAWSILGEVGVIPNRLTAAIGFRGGHNGDPARIGENTADNATTLALTYSLAQNIQFSLNHSWYSGGGSRSDESAAGFGTNPADTTGTVPTSGPKQLTTITVWSVF